MFRLILIMALAMFMAPTTVMADPPDPQVPDYQYRTITIQPGAITITQAPATISTNTPVQQQVPLPPVQAPLPPVQAPLPVMIMPVITRSIVQAQPTITRTIIQTQPNQIQRRAKIIERRRSPSTQTTIITTNAPPPPTTFMTNAVNRPMMAAAAAGCSS